MYYFPSRAALHVGFDLAGSPARRRLFLPSLADQCVDSDWPQAWIPGRPDAPAHCDCGGVGAQLASADFRCKLGKSIAVQTRKPVRSGASFQGCITTSLAFGSLAAVLSESGLV